MAGTLQWVLKNVEVLKHFKPTEIRLFYLKIQVLINAECSHFPSSMQIKLLSSESLAGLEQGAKSSTLKHSLFVMN